MTSRLAASVAYFGVALALCAQDATPVFTVQSDLVLVDVQVAHKKLGTPGPPLQRDGFRIFVDGVAQEISSFSRDELPLSIVLLFDITGSDRPVLRQFARTARGALDRLKPGDEVAVMTAAATATLIDGFTANHDRAAEAIAAAVATKPHRQKALFNEDIYGAAMQLAKATNPLSRRVVIWLTDNFYDASKLAPDGHTEADAISALHRGGVVVTPMLLSDPVYSALFPLTLAAEDPTGALRKSNPQGDAHTYAELSGGQVFRVRGREASQRLAELIDSLRARYTIGFRPSEQKPAGAFCKLRVELTPASLLRPAEWNVLVREGYYCGAPASPGSTPGK
jgi:VWFA-related protein